MIFLWSERNEEHIGKHDVDRWEASSVVESAAPPYPEFLSERRWSVWGKTDHGRLIQVVFVDVLIEDVEPDEYAGLTLSEKMALEDGERAVRVIHARDLTETEKRRYRRRTRG